MVVTNRCL